MAVLGSVHMFSDQYFDKEENGKIMVRLFFVFSKYHSKMSICLL